MKVSKLKWVPNRNKELFPYFGWKAFVWNQQLRLLMTLEQKQKSKNLGMHFGRFMYPTLFLEIDTLIKTWKGKKYRAFFDHFLG